MKYFNLLIILLPLIGFSQNSEIKNIDSLRVTYETIIKNSQEEELDFYPPHITFSSVLMQRAIGTVNTEVTIYFDMLEDDVEEDIPVEYPSIRLVKVNINSGSYHIEKTFYFESNDQFSYYKHHEIGYDCYQLEYYYSNNNLIYLKQKSLKTNDCISDTVVENRTTSKLNKQDLTLAKIVQSKAKEYNNLLMQYMNCLEY